MPQNPLFNAAYAMKLDIGTQGSGGWGGIRTHERLAPLPVFKTGALNRSATHPTIWYLFGFPVSE
jgi:hypothetical protein